MSEAAGLFSPVPSDAPARAKELLQWAIRNCARRVSEMPELRAEALVLVGSMARGEASVLETGNGLLCLSDMEFLLAVRNDRKARQRVQALRALTEQVTKEAVSRGLECKFEFAPINRTCFRTIRPSIFALELREHGQIVWGDPSLLRTMPTFPVSSIPRRDAFYLVCNRMVEQLALWLKIVAGDSHEVDRVSAYSLVKAYVDLGTSLLVFADRYESTYALRAERLASLRKSGCEDIPAFALLLDRIAFNTSLKLSPSKGLQNAIPKDLALRRWAELARCALHVWQWEYSKLDGIASPGGADHILRFVQTGGIGERLWEWAKLARFATGHSNVADVLRARYLSGLPRNRLYAGAVITYAEIAKLQTQFPFLKASATDLLPIRCPGPLTPEDTVTEILRIWTTYFRNA